MSIRQLTPFRQVYNAVEALHDCRRMLSELVAAQQAPSSAAAAPVADCPQAPIAIYDRLGFRLLLDRDSTIDRALIETGEWESEQLDYFATLVDRMRGREGAVFVDVGAYWGLYSLVAHRSGAFATLRAFEADQHNFSQLQANLFLNDAARSVQCINKAASLDDRPLLFRHSGSHADGNRGGSGVLPHDTTLPRVQVPATSIDAVLADLGDTPRDVLLKIDVEGFEAYVLQGMAETVRRHRVVVQVEIFDLHAEPAFEQIARLGLVPIQRLYPDYWFTNHPDFLPAA